MLKHRSNLFECDAGKPFDKLCHGRAVLQVLEQSGNGYPSATENPRATDTIPVAFDRRTTGPIDHDEDVSTMAGDEARRRSFELLPLRSSAGPPGCDRLRAVLI